LQTVVLPFQAAHHPRIDKSATRYSLYGNHSHAKTYPGILNISLSISTAQQLIDILNSVFVTFTIQCWLKNYWTKKLLQVGLEPADLKPMSPVSSYCAITYTKTWSHHNVSITGHKKLKKLDNVKIGSLKRKNRDHKKVPKQDKGTANLQTLLHLRSLFLKMSYYHLCARLTQQIW